MSPARPAEHYIHGNYAIVVLPARICDLLDRHAGLNTFRIRHRGSDAELDSVLVALHAAGLKWRESATGTMQAATAELKPDSEWMSTTQVGNRLGISDRAIRKAIDGGQIKATKVAGRWRITREDFHQYKTRRTS